MGPWQKYPVQRERPGILRAAQNRPDVAGIAEPSLSHLGRILIPSSWRARDRDGGLGMRDSQVSSVRTPVSACSGGGNLLWSCSYATCIPRAIGARRLCASGFRHGRAKNR